MIPQAGPAEFREALFRANDLHAFAEGFLAEDRVPWAFRDDATTYNAFKAHLASVLRTPSTHVYIVGSANTGFALSPDAFPRAFHEFSDIDVAIVAPQLFDVLWFGLVKWGHPRRYRLPPLENRWLLDRQDDLFWGWFVPQRLSFQDLRFGRDLSTVRSLRTTWLHVFRGLGEVFPGSELARREVSGRLYRTRDHLVHYQSESLRRLRYQLQNPTR